jgi:hypothetical protein
VFSLPFSRRVSSVVGDFNDWNPATTQFIESADRRRLEATVVLAPGTHAYRIVVDGKETLDEYNNLRDENLGVNVVVVPGACSESTEFSASEDRLP